MDLRGSDLRGYGPGRSGDLDLETVTDNRMRTTPEIRHLFTKHGGNLGEPNSVAWMFAKRGYFAVAASATTEDGLMEVVLDAGADDLSLNEDRFEITCPVEALGEVQKALEAAGLETVEASVIMDPSTTVELDGKKAEQCLKLLETLEDQEDVQNVYANLEVEDSAVS